MAKELKFEVKLTDSEFKKTAVSALEYCLAQTLHQFELKYNVAITGIKPSVEYNAEGNNTQRTSDLKSVRLQWQETAEGIRTDEEVKQLLAQQVEKVRNSITDKLAGNGQ